MQHSLIWGLVGAIIFTILLILIAITGLAAAARDQEGRFKKLSPKSVLGFGIFLIFLIGFPAWGVIDWLSTLGECPSFYQLWLHAFSIFFVVHLYDLLILDYLIIVRWHPKWMKLPDTAYYNEFRPHLIGFIRGIPFGIVTTLLSAGLAWWWVN